MYIDSCFQSLYSFNILKKEYELGLPFFYMWFWEFSKEYSLSTIYLQVCYGLYL